MCGIVGAIIKGSNGFFQKEEATFAELLYVDALRGFDSTGVVGVLNDASFFTMKEASEAAIFLPKLREHEMFKGMYARGKLWIGHNRKKTIGEIDDQTAHPFVVDNTFAMVHNGTLFNWEKLYKGKEKPFSDSHALALCIKEALDEHHPIKALERVDWWYIWSICPCLLQPEDRETTSVKEQRTTSISN
jgi:glucosamine 6-phosphate synthetase-like amidotransferase/phosphosugar isomerase protein